MRTLFLFLLLPLFVEAQSVILVQKDNDVLLHSQLDSAMIEAPIGSTVYIPGGHFDVPNEGLIIDKQLRIIGAGHYPDSTVATGRTVIDGNVFLITGADGGSIEGVYIDGNIEVGKSSNNETNINGYIIKRSNINYLDLGYTEKVSLASNFLIKDCVIRNDVSGDNIRNTIFLNNHFYDRLAYFDGNNVSFENNIFFYSTNSSSYDLLVDVDEVTFKNNFFKSIYLFDGSSNNDFYNNIFEASSLPNQRVLSNNILGQDFSSQFMNYSGSGFSYNDDYHLANGSLGKNAGQDGRDIGVYGGVNPYKEGAVPSNPHIQFSEIGTQTDVNGKLKVHFKVSAQEN